jgi:hypothetical protein
MEEWKKIRVKGVSKIEKVIAIFEIWAIEKVPYAKFKIKIIENNSGEYVGVPNIAVKNADGSPDWIGGFGSNSTEALEDTLKYFMESLNDRDDLTEDDFEWAAPEDF